MVKDNRKCLKNLFDDMQRFQLVYHMENARVICIPRNTHEPLRDWNTKKVHVTRRRFHGVPWESVSWLF